MRTHSLIKTLLITGLLTGTSISAKASEISSELKLDVMRYAFTQTCLKEKTLSDFELLLKPIGFTFDTTELCNCFSSNLIANPKVTSQLEKLKGASEAETADIKRDFAGRGLSQLLACASTQIDAQLK